MPNSSGASLFGKHPTITGLYVGLTDSSSTVGTDPVAFCIFRNVSLDTTANVYHHGCIAILVSGGTGTNAVYQNTGSYAVPVWTLFDTGTGFSLPTSATDATTTTGTSLGLTANSVTTGQGISLSTTGLTTGSGILVTGGTSMASGADLFDANLGAATAGAGLDVTTTGIYTDVTGLISITANSATTGNLEVLSATGLTTGTIFEALAAAATLTTGFYYTANDGALNVFTVGANGHITSNQTTAPTIAVTTQNGITAAAVTAGSTDTCGKITTTGTSTAATLLTVTFNKTYTVAPKVVILTPANAAAAMPNTGYVVLSSSISATSFQITVAAGGTYAATPSWYYQVIA